MSEMLEVEASGPNNHSKQKSHLNQTSYPFWLSIWERLNPWALSACFIMMLYLRMTHSLSHSVLYLYGTRVNAECTYMFCIYIPPKIIKKCEIQCLSYLIRIMCEKHESLSHLRKISLREEENVNFIYCMLIRKRFRRLYCGSQLQNLQGCK